MADSGPRDTGGGPGASAAPVPDPEVVPRASRRTYTSKYKLRILKEVDGCKEDGEVGGVLRREGLYSSLLSTWREQRRRGVLEPLGKGRGRDGKSAAEVESDGLRAENATLRRRLEQMEAMVDVQKKCLLMLGLAEPAPRGGS